MKQTNIFLLLILCIFLGSCATKRLIKFPQKGNDIYSSQQLKVFFKENKNPKVVLRIPAETKNVAESQKRNYYYDVIEKELLKNGFIVRDRQLFNHVLSNVESKSDYSKIKEKTDTELIIELIQLNTRIKYETNKYHTEKGKEKSLGYVHSVYGAEIEFKVILIKNNELAGSYMFNYSPCSNSPCVIDKNASKKWDQIKKGKIKYESVEEDYVVDFIADAIEQFVKSLRE